MELPIRKRIRLKGHDYSQNGYYHVTICTKHRMNLLGNVGNAVPGVPSRDNETGSVGNAVLGVTSGDNQNIPKITPTPIGEMVIDCWRKMSQIDENIKTDCFCIMPDHVHGIIIIQNQNANVPEVERRGRRSLHDLVRGFKSTTTRLYNAMVPEYQKNTLWQSSFYDEIIRNEEALNKIRYYIVNNPMK